MTLPNYLRLLDEVLQKPTEANTNQAKYWMPYFLNGISCVKCKKNCHPLDFCHYKLFEPNEQLVISTNELDEAHSLA